MNTIREESVNYCTPRVKTSLPDYTYLRFHLLQKLLFWHRIHSLLELLNSSLNQPVKNEVEKGPCGSDRWNVCGKYDTISMIKSAALIPVILFRNSRVFRQWYCSASECDFRLVTVLRKESRCILYDHHQHRTEANKTNLNLIWTLNLIIYLYVLCCS
jgi:hypothetical protein